MVYVWQVFKSKLIANRLNTQLTSLTRTTATGEANERSSGTVASIAELAQKLDNFNNPVICIESDKKLVVCDNE